jgi:hypothetical protein
MYVNNDSLVFRDINWNLRTSNLRMFYHENEEWGKTHFNFFKNESILNDSNFTRIFFLLDKPLFSRVFTKTSVYKKTYGAQKHLIIWSQSVD